MFQFIIISTFLLTFPSGDSNNLVEPAKFHPSMLRSPDQPPALPAHQSIGLGAPSYPPHASAPSVCSAATTATVNNSMNNNNNMQVPSNILNASTSTHSSNNFYQNTMLSDTSSLHKRKSVISSQSTGSSNDVSDIK